MGSSIIAWVNEWFIDNAKSDISELTESFISAEVSRFVMDASAKGIKRTQLEDALGDLHIYMGDEYERVINEAKHECAGRGD